MNSATQKSDPELGGGVSKYLSQMVEDACSALAQPVAADGTVADPQAGGTSPLRILNTNNRRLVYYVVLDRTAPHRLLCCTGPHRTVPVPTGTVPFRSVTIHSV
jgi:hypothetical protein